MQTCCGGSDGEMNLRNIEYVLAIAETGSFSHASRILHISQPALTQAIQKLEDDLNTKLFIRQHNKTLVTRAGELFLEDAKQILLLSEQIKRKMLDIEKGEEGDITIGLSQYNGQIYFASTILEFKLKFPKMKMTIMEDYSWILEQKLEAGKIDVAFITEPYFRKDLFREHLFHEEIFLAAPLDHPIKEIFSEKADGFACTKLSELKDESFVLMKPDFPLRIFTDKLFKEVGFEPKIVLESGNVNTIQSLVTGGMGLGFLTATHQKNTPKRWKSAYYHLSDVNARREHAIAYNNKLYLSKTAKVFIEMAKKVCLEQFKQIND